ncbi:glycosyltransferase family 2 protein [Novosphingobium sp. MD-1]|uniref:glycosyltransferase family 2 protein n=1 Tax=Novosphingobium sp. MD-1 TaxID=1630648 RepID=UPI00061CBD7F|nr:glycosyltransferase family 2 protein [Novosphingobium sp. MD-1]GAO55344.1 beta-1,3-glucosyltransferase [Novosphingobium sp. MD-1]
METVTSIIPAFNAADTIERTLRSALAQTHGAQEILVIDDGSTDETGRIAEALAATDPRIRVIHQQNRGLAGARNRGIDEATGDFIAPLDADDLWHPEKLTRQIAAIRAIPGSAMAYGWFRRIDQDDRVLPGSASPVVEGWAFHRHLDHNFISNGSSPLIRTDAARAIRYDESIDACEDYLFQLEIARRWPIACARAYLTGYRRRTTSMSGDAGRMIRAHLALFRRFHALCDGAALAIIRERIARLEIELARNRLRRRAPGDAARAIGRALSTDAGAACGALVEEAARAVRRAREPLFPPPAAPFDRYLPEEADGAWNSGRSPRRDAWLATLDEAAGAASH